ncbi:MAG: Xaa-Pro peptidase family protein [Chloroflexota bacterium]
MQTVQTQITGKHRAKIGSNQVASKETAEHIERERVKALNLHTLGPGALAVGEWEAAGLELPDQTHIRRYRLERVRAELRKFDYAGVVLYDPLNVRYATDSTNMQLWITHNAARYAFVPTEGPVIMFDYHSTQFLSDHSEVVDETRVATSWFYFSAGDRYQEKAEKWAEEIADLVAQYGGGNKRIAIDRCNPEAFEALQSHGIGVFNGEQLMERARQVKCDEEIKAMRCAIHACDQAMEVMRTKMVPGISEQRLWSYLHAENIARGGEWIETRIMAAGPRCNPWFQECSSYEIQSGEFVAFDTDLIGSYGVCVDISRTWICGDVKPTDEQREIYDMAYEQIQRNTEWLKPGLSFKELSFDSHQYDPNEFGHYSCLYHGVGLCDEYPSICFPAAWENHGLDDVLIPGMVVCVESYMGRHSGGPGVKLEDQVLITETGHELLSHYPIQEILTN